MSMVHAESSGYATTTTVEAIAARLRAAKRVLVLTHSKPDGDAIGSTVALVRALEQRGTRAMVVYVGPVPRWGPMVIGSTHAKTVEGPTAGEVASEFEEADLIVIMDTGAWSQVDELRAMLTGKSAKIIVVDHHLSGSPDLADERLVESSAAAAAELSARICCALLGVAPSALPIVIAEPLYLGLATDTGWFHFSNTKPTTLRLAADLVDAGVDFPRLFEMIEQQDRPARLRLLGRALESMELHKANTIALMTLTRADFEHCHGDSEDTGGFANYALAVAGMQVAGVLVEAAGREGKGPLSKLSLRSKPGTNAVDVAAVCQKLGGGGHARAAGAKLAMSMAEAKIKVHEALGIS